jgi:hypothetical protein
MAYNNMFPVGYQSPQMYYPQYQTPQPQANPSNGIIWVQGEAGAKSYLVAPNTTVQLWDSEKQVIYLKSADASGMPSMKVLDYQIREMNQPVAANTVANNNIYATKEELREFKEAFEARIRELMPKETDNG